MLPLLVLGWAGQDTQMNDGQVPRSCRYTIYNKVQHVNTDMLAIAIAGATRCLDNMSSGGSHLADHHNT